MPHLICQGAAQGSRLCKYRQEEQPKFEKRQDVMPVTIGCDGSRVVDVCVDDGSSNNSTHC